MKTVLIKVNHINPNKFKNSYMGGIGRSLYHLLEALNDYKNLPFNITLYASGIKSVGFDFYNWKFNKSIFLLPESFKVLDKNFEPYYRRYLTKNNLFHIPHNVDDIYDGENFVTTIHDCEHYLRTEDSKLKKRYEYIVSKASTIITCSEFSKQEIVNIFNVAPEKVKVIYWGISKNIYKPIENAKLVKDLHNLGLAGKYFFACSCNVERKNIITALRAFKKFIAKRREHKFVLLWSNPPEKILKEFQKEINNKQIIFLNHVSDEQLVSLYNGASLTVFPSLYEGFGFPILESLACGTPIMTCNNSSLHEVGGDVALYVKEDSIDEMVDVMKEFEVKEFKNTEFEQRRLNHIKKFSWANTAKGYVDVYTEQL